ncbi:MAG: sialidase family protein [Promethearchaeota archaeon]
MKKSNRNKFLQYFAIFLLITLYSLSFFIKFVVSFNGSNEIRSSQEDHPEILAFSDNRLLSIDDGIYAHHVEVSMAISDFPNEVIFVGWKNSETHYGGGARVSIVKSTDNGETWSNPYNMPMYAGRFTRQSDPWLYWYNGTIYYAYLEFESGYFSNPSGDYLTQITIAKSIDYGNTWTPVKATNGTYFADKETMVVGENNTIYVAYDDVDITPTGNATVRISRSIDGGDTYQEISNLGEDFYFLGPYVTLNTNGDVFLAWTWAPDQGGNLYFTKSLDRAITFDTPQLVNQDGNYCFFQGIGNSPSKATLPVIKFDKNDRLYLLWADRYDQPTDTWDVYLRYSDDFGSTWSERIRINPSTSGQQWNPDMVIDETGRLHIVYYSEVGENYKPYYRTVNFTGSYRNETEFSDQIAIADRDTSSAFFRPGEYFAIQLDNNGIPHVAWSDGRDNELDIYYARGLTEIPPAFDMVLIIVIIAIISIISLVTIFYIRHRRRLQPITDKADKITKERRKTYKKTFLYFCETCKKFNHTFTEYCENCGGKASLREATKKDYEKYMPELK